MNNRESEVQWQVESFKILQRYKTCILYKEKDVHDIFFYYRLDKFSKETTVVNQIFGGFLRSQGMENLNQSDNIYVHFYCKVIRQREKKFLRKFKMIENNQV